MLFCNETRLLIKLGIMTWLKPRSFLFGLPFRRLFSEKNSLFIEKSRFKPTEPGLLLYSSSERPFLVLFSVAFAGSFIVYVSRAISDYQSGQELLPNLLMSVFTSGCFLGIQWKLRKTVKNLYLDISGKKAVLELFRFGGIYSQGFYIANRSFLGTGLFYPKLLRNYKVPVIHFKGEGAKGYLFFKTDYVQDLELFRSLITGKEFLVSDDPALSIKVSKKLRNTYKI